MLLLRIVASGTTALILFSIGVSLNATRFRQAFDPTSPSFHALAATEIVALLVVPAATYALLLLARPPTPLTVGLLNMACVPGGSFSNMLALPTGANVELNAALTCVSSTCSIVLITLANTVLIPGLLGTKHTGAPPLGFIVMDVIVFLVCPLLGGLACSRAPRLKRVVRRALPILLPLVLVLAAVTTTWHYVSNGVPQLSWDAFVLPPVLVAFCLVASLAAGIACGASRRDLASMLLESTVHDFGLAQATLYSIWGHALSADDLDRTVAVAALYSGFSCGAVLLAMCGRGAYFCYARLHAGESALRGSSLSRRPRVLSASSRLLEEASPEAPPRLVAGAAGERGGVVPAVEGSAEAEQG